MSTSSSSKRYKLSAVTFTLSEQPSKAMQRELLWCNTVPKGKRCKPAKIMGIQHSEISMSSDDLSSPTEHTYYQPVQSGS